MARGDAGRAGQGAQTDRAAQQAYVEVERALLRRLPEHKSVEGPTLERIRLLCELLGEPQHAAPVIHLTGTNGKTSTARMVDSLLAAFGVRAGRLTSPHLAEIRERISLSGEPVSPERFVQAYHEVMPFVDLADPRLDRPLSFFEIVTAIGFAVFADAPVDAAVLEVGLGGRFDATNVADGRVAVVTPVAVDHAQYLGDTPVEIAGEKAGIIKSGAVAVIAQQEVEVAEVLMRRAAEVGASVAREGLEFGVVNRDIAVGGQQLTLQGLHGTYGEIFLPLHGAHQAHNASVALAAVEAFLAGGVTEGEGLDADLVREGFANVSSPGRLEVVRRSPTVLLDAAHNPHGATATAAAVTESFSFEPLIGVVGVMADKDVEGVLEAFEPVLSRIVVTQNSTARAMPAAELAEIAMDIFGEERVSLAPRLDEALDLGMRLAEEEASALGSGGVLVTGSVITAGEARVLLGGR
ncbi:dihydrofolate synthase / folylpolyglutamate synthase [Actinopolymorpha cephalotaxi]|uniref:Dihydrofolate synthase/folylpolyglutamate synthase n=1 Tax=Actinopolymorpha cephalotaxi TaxID=504797 RepID=A0A1I2ZHV0_9ACTN|nr:folylpolyglutamate synthase/dihydrofolate synthase family protein [Actinopolymorpha cephalotaxi]NYH82004.1 dihydrofolate synthase/folylpolyglutamate synthase [Actinopolymorpha cephalotaxi]SFH37393.1 dihydrofolate synthase / folylpolyglutamate synthase [Actinopolymorpha cephalotaxi]